MILDNLINFLDLSLDQTYHVFPQRNLLTSEIFTKNVVLIFERNFNTCKIVKMVFVDGHKYYLIDSLTVL